MKGTDRKKFGKRVRTSMIEDRYSEVWTRLGFSRALSDRAEESKNAFPGSCVLITAPNITFKSQRWVSELAFPNTFKSFDALLAL